MKISKFAPRFNGICAFIVAPAALMVLTSCEVKQTQEAKAPKVEVKDGQLPKYEVDTAKVSVDSQQTEVTVPKVTTEQKSITVPKIDVTMPGEQTPVPTASPTP